MKHRGWMVGIALVAALAAGVGAGYVIWGWPPNWYARDVTKLPAAERCERGIGRTFQVVKSFETMSVIDNVIVGALVRNTVMRTARQKAHRAARTARSRARPRARF